MAMTVEGRASQLLNEVLEEYYSRPEWDDRSLMQMIDEKLMGYNDDMIAHISLKIREQLGDFLHKGLPDEIARPIELSDMLYKNSSLVGAQVYELLKEATYTRETASELAKSIYDGYGSEDDILDVIDNMPNYLQDFLETGDMAEFFDKVGELKTEPFRVANEELMDAIASLDEDAIQSALDTILYEKARYYAERIAKTEIQRSKALANAYQMITDPNIKLVKWELSSRHKIFDICDYHATLDVGYGPGIYPKGQHASIPLHPFCMCKVIPYYHKVKKKRISNPEKKAMEKFTPDQQRAVAGSWDKLGEWMNGKPLQEIWNESRPKYPILPVADVLRDRSKWVYPPSGSLKPIPGKTTPDPTFKGNYPRLEPANELTKDIRQEAKDLINKYTYPMAVKWTRPDDGYYIPETRFLASEKNTHTFLHEYGHHIDNMIGAWENGGGIGYDSSFTRSQEAIKDLYDAMIADKTALGLDMTTYKDKIPEIMKDWFTREETFFKRGPRKGMRKGFIKEPTKDLYRAFSDIFDSMMGGHVHKDLYYAGHGTRYYKSVGHRVSENFANLFALWADGTEWDMVQQLFPTMAKQFEELMRVSAEGGI